MSESTLFKDNLNETLAANFGRAIQQVYAEFNTAGFVAQIAAQLAPLELKERVAVFTAALHDFLPQDYGTAVAILRQLLPQQTGQDQSNLGWALWSVAHFVEVYGLEAFAESMAAMHEITQHFSCEFAIRPYLVRYPQPTLAVLDEWTADPQPQVRRLVSEGTRPRLPWGSRLYQFIDDPRPTLA
ncbi:MAG: hypothetical protein WBP47_18890, partial [Candidatus Promineifilaceae bacterium]